MHFWPGRGGPGAGSSGMGHGQMNPAPWSLPVPFLDVAELAPPESGGLWPTQCSAGIQPWGCLT